MSTFFWRAVVGGMVAVLALGAIAFAVADSASNGDTSAPENVAEEATPTASAIEETDQETSTRAATEATDALDSSATESAEPANGDLETTTALNPAGHCVAVPNTSDVIRHPDKHTRWTITACEPSDDGEEQDADEPEDIEEGNAAEDNESVEKVPATNPSGKCKELPVTSDIVQHPEKHPGWELGECGEPEE